MSVGTRLRDCSRRSHLKPDDNGSTKRHSGRCCGCVASSATPPRTSPKHSLYEKSLLNGFRPKGEPPTLKRVTPNYGLDWATSPFACNPGESLSGILRD